jgi:hypothetical protein
MKDEIFMKLDEEKKEKYLLPYAKKCKKCEIIYPRHEKYFFINSQKNLTYCLICKEKNCIKKNKNKIKIEN